VRGITHPSGVVIVWIPPTTWDLSSTVRPKYSNWAGEWMVTPFPSIAYWWKIAIMGPVWVETYAPTVPMEMPKT
jgi:hypothetical protein